MFTFTVPFSQQPVSLKEALARLHISLTLRRKLKQSADAILVNGQAAAWQTTVHPGDTISIVWPADCRIAPLPMPLKLAFEDDSLLVVDKPAGLLVHPTTDPSRTSLANAVIALFQERGLLAGFHPVHRLDRNTSGLILLAKNPHLQHLLSSANGVNIDRYYLALVTGIVEAVSGVIDAPIGRHPDSIIQRIVHPAGQPAITYYEKLRIIGSTTLLRLRLFTGRTHQIRVHLAHIGHPILGDDLYGGSIELIERQALHAAYMSFVHPLTAKVIKLTSPLPADMTRLVDQ